jgi:hypothetical protein
MDCYECATAGIERHAVALCRSCGAGLCMEHLRQTASYFATGAIRPACSHGTWSVPVAARRVHSRHANLRHKARGRRPLPSAPDERHPAPAA